MSRLIIRILQSRTVSHLWKRFAESRFSRLFIPLFSRLYRIQAETIDRNLKDYLNLQDFFTRSMDLSYRPLGRGRYLSPADGVISAAGAIKREQSFEVKGQSVNLRTLLGRDSDLDYAFYQLIYLSPKNYHRFHAPVQEKVREVYALGAESLPVNELGFRLGNPLMHNYRYIIEYESLTMIPIGAVNVNAIQLTQLEAAQGEELGRFCLGSSILLLYRQRPAGQAIMGPIQLRQDLFALED